MGSERRGRAVHGRVEVNPSGEEPTDGPRQKNAGLWEPYDGRLSRTVLREREGEVPSRHSPGSLGESEGLGGFRALEDVSGGLECLLFIVAGCDCGGDGFREAGVGDLDARGGFVAAEPGLV